MMDDIGPSDIMIIVNHAWNPLQGLKTTKLHLLKGGGSPIIMTFMQG